MQLRRMVRMPAEMQARIAVLHKVQMESTFRTRNMVAVREVAAEEGVAEEAERAVEVAVKDQIR